MGMTRKQISFDLSQDALKRYYPHKETGQDSQFFKRAYKDIRRFMEANGFERRQYSVYVSLQQRTSLDVALLAQRMGETLPWLRLCVKDITVTNIEARHNYGAPTQPSEAVAVGRGGRNGAGGVLAVRRGRNRAEFLPMRGCCAPMRCPPNSCRLFPKRLIKREKCRSDRREKRYSTAEPDISFSRSPFVYWTSYVPWAKSKHASFPLASM